MGVFSYRPPSLPSADIKKSSVANSFFGDTGGAADGCSWLVAVFGGLFPPQPP